MIKNEQPLIRIIDDDQSQRQALAFLLTSVGYRVASYGSARDFLTRDEHWVGGCAILDLRMPEMDGLSLQREMIQRGISLPIIFLSAYGDLPIAVEAMKLGSFDFLEKPVDEAKLLACLTDILTKEVQLKELRNSPVELQKKWNRLSEQEKLIAKLYANGLIKRQIAERLSVRHKTVDNHLQSVYKKLDIHSIEELKSISKLLLNQFLKA